MLERAWRMLRSGGESILEFWPIKIALSGVSAAWVYLFGGSALLLSGISGATGYEGIGGFPTAFTDFANQTLFGLPVPLVIFMVCVLLFWLLMHRTHSGRWLQYLLIFPKFVLQQHPRNFEFLVPSRRSGPALHI